MSETLPESPLRGPWTFERTTHRASIVLGVTLIGFTIRNHQGEPIVELVPALPGSLAAAANELLARAICAVPDLVDASVLVSEWTHQVNPDQAAATIAEAQMIVGATFALDAIFPDTPEGHAALDQYHRRPPAAKEPQ